MTGFGVDPALLDAVAARLDAAGAATVEGVGEPAVPDAGEVSGEVGALMAHLVAQAAELAGGLTVAGEGVAASSAGYRTQDAAVAAALGEAG